MKKTTKKQTKQEVKEVALRIDGTYPLPDQMQEVLRMIGHGPGPRISADTVSKMAKLAAQSIAPPAVRVVDRRNSKGEVIPIEKSKYLTVDIYRGCKRADLVREIKRLYKQYCFEVEKKKTRKRPGGDPWQARTLADEGKKDADIVKAITGCSGKTEYDPVYKKGTQKVRTDLEYTAAVREHVKDHSRPISVLKPKKTKTRKRR